MSQDFSLTLFPDLETQRLWLRQATQEDAEAVFAVFSDPKVTRFHDLDTFTHLDEAIGVIERWVRGFENGHRMRWGIARKRKVRQSLAYIYELAYMARSISVVLLTLWVRFPGFQSKRRG
jgi:RimJ/RimL family protein N-acetyltransferase